VPYQAEKKGKKSNAQLVEIPDHPRGWTGRKGEDVCSQRNGGKKKEAALSLRDTGCPLEFNTKLQLEVKGQTVIRFRTRKSVVREMRTFDLSVRPLSMQGEKPDSAQIKGGRVSLANTKRGTEKC